MTLAAFLSFAGDHKALLIVAALCGACFFAGRASVRPPPPPTVHAAETDHGKDDRAASLDQKTDTGAKRIVTLNFDPVGPLPHPPIPFDTARAGAIDFPEQHGAPADLCRPVIVPGLGSVTAPPGERLESVTIEEDAASTTSTHAEAEEHQQLDRKLDLTVSPAPPRSWLQLSAGLDDVLHPALRNGRIAARVRLFDTGTWAELSSRPLNKCDDGRWCPQLGAGVAIDF